VQKEGLFSDEIGSNENVYGTHHIGASTEQAQSAVADETLRILTEYIRTGYVHNCVNLLAKTPASYVISVHHRNRVGVLAGVLDIIRESSINVEIMENTIFQGGDGACARIQIDGVLKEEDLRRIEQSSENIFSVSQVKI